VGKDKGIPGLGSCLSGMFSENYVSGRILFALAHTAMHTTATHHLMHATHGHVHLGRSMSRILIHVSRKDDTKLVAQKAKKQPTAENRIIKH